MKRVVVERNRYFDSVFLMRISHELEQRPNVVDAIVAMGTPANLANLANAGYTLDDARESTISHVRDEPAGAIHANDVVIAIEAATDEAIKEAKAHLARLLAGRTSEAEGRSTASPTTLAEAIETQPTLNLALISVPGTYAAREARRALRHGLHVMLFSDNVAVDEEIALKDEAVERSLLMMGPDCGTAILNGTPLGFANVVQRGSIGIVGASGTGLQEISSLIHRLGGGISQAIGTGGRDLSGPVGGRMTRFGIAALADDPDTNVLVVVSKTPAPAVADRVLDALRSAGKSAVVHFVAGGERTDEDTIRFAPTLEDTARVACAQADAAARDTDLPDSLPAVVRSDGSVRGLFCGGTLAQEAWDVLRRAGIEVWSNVAATESLRIEPGAHRAGHVVWDLGDDAFTVGTPHPMIEPSLRDEKVAACGDDGSVGIVLADCVLGYGAHPDPAGSLAAAAERAMQAAARAGRTLRIVASVTGTNEDPQHRDRQVAALTEARVLVAPSNAAAARWTAAALTGGTR